MEAVVYLSLAVASIAFTLTETRLFRSLRDWAKGKSSLFGKLTSCGYCVGHWVALALVAIYKPKLFNSWWFLDYFLTAIVIAWLSGLQWALMCWLMEKTEK